MTIESHAGSRGDTETSTSPFAGLSYLTQSVGEERAAADDTEAPPFDGFHATESPFGEDIAGETDPVAAESADFLESIHDEDFDEALEQLLNDGAALLLSDAQQWSAPASEAEAREAVEQWIAPLAAEWQRAVDGLGAGLEGADLSGLVENELDELLDSLDSPAAFDSEAFDNFLGRLLGKAKSFVKRKIAQAVTFAKNPIKGVVDAAKSGLQTIRSGVESIGRHLLGPLLEKLKNVGLTLLKGVVSKLMAPLSRVLPAPIRPVLPLILKRLGVGEAADDESDEATSDEMGLAAQMAHEFDNRLLSLYLAGDSESPTADETTDSYEPEQAQNLESELDDARVRLATQLSEYTGSQPPVAEIEQFIPAVLAIRPLLKLGLTVTGAREKLINLIAGPLASLIKNMIGPTAAATITRAVGREPSRMIAKAAVNVGFSALGLESAAGPDGGIAGEALASAVESTVLRVVDQLDEAALADPLQVGAAVAQAFAESAAAYLPDRLLRADLPERETAEEGGLWVMMPRSSRPRYRFRRYTRVFVVPVSRQTARAVGWSDGGTLESYLLDRGVTQWPVQAEVDLYETLPGTLPGHFTRDETLPADEHAAAEEYQPLTKRTAGLLLGEPALGRGRTTGVRAGGFRPGPGQRFFRIRSARLPARRVRRPRRLVSVHWDPQTNRMRIFVRLSERQARALQARLQRAAPSGQRDLPGVLLALWQVALPRLPYRIARRLVGSSTVTDATAAARIGTAITAATRTGITTFLTHSGAQFAAAVADPADGVTITVTFDGVGAGPTQVPAPTVSVSPGMLR
ncbi:hypothetical protein [Millisia brevis]|uniref:hypothetical protein n=1 Tax=Millisia brevis TaxID=264148 RepID=UPI000835B27F|nr:hypothetical protein [Millisia brevis]